MGTACGRKELSVELLPGSPQGTELEEALEESEESDWIRQSKPEAGAKESAHNRMYVNSQREAN